MRVTAATKHRLPLPRQHPEHAMQAAFFVMVDGDRRTKHLPIFAVPNAARRSPRQGAWMKAEGLRAGIPDLQLDVARSGFHGLRIELKAGKNQESEEQTKVLASLRRRGYKTMTCYSADAAIDEIQDYLDGKAAA